MSIRTENVPMINHVSRKIYLEEFLNLTDLNSLISENLKNRGRENQNTVGQSSTFAPLVIVGPSGVGKGTLIRQLF
jgi:ribose 1,5-bisphosphokinase PhnN